MKQTAVEWLMEQILPTISIRLSDTYIKELTNQSKAIEKEQIIEANEDCSTNELGEFLTGEQYYNENYGN
jgi:hypothetical protein